MATRKKGTTTRAKNPGGLRVTGGGKKPAAKRSTAVAKRTNGRKKPGYRRNPSPGANILLFAVGGVVVVKAFDAIVRYLAPTLAAPISIGLMAAGAFGVHAYGRKLLGSWADVVACGLGIFAVARAWDAWVNPLLPAVLGGSPQIISTAAIKDNSTGQIGTRFYLNDGNYADTWDTAYAN